jgi:hypothetical protein
MEVPVEAGRAEVGGQSALERARVRWRSAGDRVWSIAVVDGEEYRRAAELVGGVLAQVREQAPTLERLLALDADPAPLLDRWRAEAGGAVGLRAVFDAACAVRSDELLAVRAREERVAAIAAAREAGERWVELDASADPGWSARRSVAMHVASGLAVVATADPFSGPEPYALAETVLDAQTGDPLAGSAGREVAFADAASWREAGQRWREEIESRLDGDGSDAFR